MTPIPTPKLSFDIIAIGGGTAGSGVIRYASRYGKKAAVVELKKGYGGTCGGSQTYRSSLLRLKPSLTLSLYRLDNRTVQVGCVPKVSLFEIAALQPARADRLSPLARNFCGSSRPSLRPLRASSARRLRGRSRTMTAGLQEDSAGAASRSSATPRSSASRSKCVLPAVVNLKDSG